MKLVPYLFILINRMEPVSPRTIETHIFVMKKPVLVLGAFSVNSWATKKTTETLVGAIFVLHSSRRDCLAAQNMVKVKKCVVRKLRFFDASKCSGWGHFGRGVGVQTGIWKWGAASSV